MQPQKLKNDQNVPNHANVPLKSDTTHLPMEGELSQLLASHAQ